MTISIIGCGWFGLELGKTLVTAGYKVKGATTTNEKMNIIQEQGIAPYLVQISTALEHISDAAFFDCDVLVITIPPKVHLIGQDEYLFIQTRLIELAINHHIKKIVLISSTSVYGDVNAEVDEAMLPIPDTLSGKVLLQTEQLYLTNPAFQTTVLRFGGLIGPGRDPGKFFTGKENIANGLAPVNLIHLDDCVGITQQIIRNDFFGVTINACSPHHPTRKDFYTYASQRSGLALPQFNEELINWKVVKSVVISERLQYEFVHPQLIPVPSI